MELSKNIKEELRRGEVSGFAELVREFSNKAFSLILKILNNREEAEDCLQEAFLKLYRALSSGQFEERSKLSTYFYTIVYNTAVEHYRKLKDKRFSIISIDVEGDNFEEGDDLLSRFRSTAEESVPDTAGTNEIAGIIRRFVESLPEQYSVILTMFFINDLSHEEISEILKLPIGTVKNRIFRAKAKLREIILKKYSEEEILQYV